MLMFAEGSWSSRPMAWQSSQPLSLAVDAANLTPSARYSATKSSLDRTACLRSWMLGRAEWNCEDRAGADPVSGGFRGGNCEDAATLPATAVAVAESAGKISTDHVPVAGVKGEV